MLFSTMTTLSFCTIIIVLYSVVTISNDVVQAFEIVGPQHQQHKEQRLRMSSSIVLNNVIRPESVDFDFDIGQGGVRLAEESVIKLTGTVSSKSSEPTITNLSRYKQLETIQDEKFVVNTLQQFGATIIAAGRGTELYADPGTTTNQFVQYGPIEAVNDSLVGAKAATDYPNIVINFCGGDDTQVLEVLSAITKLIENLKIDTKAKINFNSISHSTFPLGSSTVTVIGLKSSLSEEEVNNNTSNDKIVQAISAGEIYFREGAFYTLVEDQINPAIA